MQFENKQLIQNLTLRTEQNILAAQLFNTMSLDELNYKAKPDQWSILECLEHLNLYGAYYLPEIEKTLQQGHSNLSSKTFKSGVLGNYFANMMLPGENGKTKKMKSPKDKVPSASNLGPTTIQRFLKQQELLKKLLQLAETKDLTKLKTPISISKWIKLRLGDTFRFVIYHNQRHIDQANKIVVTLKSMKH